MPKRKTYFSLCDRIVHEGKIAVRELIHDGSDRVELLARLNELMRKPTANLSKYGALCVTIAAILSQSASGSELNIKSALMTLSVPRLYLVSAGVACWYFILLQTYSLCIYMILNLNIRNQGSSSSRFSSVRHGLQGDDNADVISPIRNSQLSGFSWGNNFWLHTTYLLPLFVCILPLFAACVVLNLELARLVSEGHSSWFNATIAIATVALSVCSNLYFVYFFTPFPIKKNLDNLRWNFLAQINKNEQGFHPTLNKWRKN